VISLEQHSLDLHFKDLEYCYVDYDDGDDISKIRDAQGSPNFSQI